MEILIVLAILALGVRWLAAPRSAAGEPGAGDGPQPLENDPLSDEAIELPVEDFLDLHAFHPRDILDVVDAYLEEAAEKGFEEVRLIHGRGQGVQRARVRSLLRRHPRVESLRDAPPERGGWGATLVSIRPGSLVRDLENE